MIRFEWQPNDQRAIDTGYPKLYNSVWRKRKRLPLVDIDNWIENIDKQIYLRNNEAYFGDNVCVFFSDDKVRIINYWDHEAGKDNYCELDVLNYASSLLNGNGLL
jgi:hypothetical protein